MEFSFSFQSPACHTGPFTDINISQTCSLQTQCKHCDNVPVRTGCRVTTCMSSWSSFAKPVVPLFDPESFSCPAGSLVGCKDSAEFGWEGKQTRSFNGFLYRAHEEWKGGMMGKSGFQNCLRLYWWLTCYNSSRTFHLHLLFFRGEKKTTKQNQEEIHVSEIIVESRICIWSFYFYFIHVSISYWFGPGGPFLLWAISEKHPPCRGELGDELTGFPAFQRPPHHIPL